MYVPWVVITAAWYFVYVALGVFLLGFAQLFNHRFTVNKVIKCPKGSISINNQICFY